MFLTNQNRVKLTTMILQTHDVQLSLYYIHSKIIHNNVEQSFEN